MSPFTEKISYEIRHRDKWRCTSCGRSSFDEDKWLLDASHINHTRNEHYLDLDNGVTSCIPCHLQQHILMHDIQAVQRIANRIWNCGIRHISVYEKNPILLGEDRVILTDLLTETGFMGRIHIDDRVHNIKEMKAYINARRRK